VDTQREGRRRRERIDDPGWLVGHHDDFLEPGRSRLGETTQDSSQCISVGTIEEEQADAGKRVSQLLVAPIDGFDGRQARFLLPTLKIGHRPPCHRTAVGGLIQRSGRV
jgi:hypothetical protein